MRVFIFVSLLTLSLFSQLGAAQTKPVIINEWWTCKACGYCNPAGIVRCDLCGQHKP